MPFQCWDQARSRALNGQSREKAGRRIGAQECGGYCRMRCNHLARRHHRLLPLWGWDLYASTGVHVAAHPPFHAMRCSGSLALPTDSTTHRLRAVDLHSMRENRRCKLRIPRKIKYNTKPVNVIIYLKFGRVHSEEHPLVNST